MHIDIERVILNSLMTPYFILSLMKILRIRYSKIQTVGSYCVVLLLLAIYKSVFFDSESIRPVFYMVIIYFFNIALMRILFTDSWSKCILTYTFFHISIIIIESITILLMLTIGIISINSPLVPNDPNTYRAVSLTNTALCILVMKGATTLWEKKQKIQRPNLHVFIIGFSCFYTLSFLYLNVISNDNQYLNFKLGGIVQAIICIFVTPFLANEIESKDTNQQHLQAQKQQASAETFSYTLLEKRRIEYAKIQHDFNNQIMVVQHLINSHQLEEARQLLNELLNQLNN